MNKRQKKEYDKAFKIALAEEQPVIDKILSIYPNIKTITFENQLKTQRELSDKHGIHLLNESCSEFYFNWLGNIYCYRAYKIYCNAKYLYEEALKLHEAWIDGDDGSG